MNPDSLFFLICALCLYGASAICIFSGFIFSRAVSSAFSGLLVRLACVFYVLNTLCVAAAYGLRWLEAGRVPLANTYETLLLFIVLTHVLYFFCVRYDRNKLVLTVFVLVQCAASAAALFLSSSPGELPAALRNPWLAFHVFTNTAAYALFAVAFVAGCLYLVKGDEMPKIQTVLYKSILFGVPFLTAGIVSGAIWAEQAWGRWWAWDPKETWALLCWLYYILFLHLRAGRLVSKRVLAVMAAGGFAVVLFTFFGVNYLLSGLHSYQ